MLLKPQNVVPTTQVNKYPLPSCNVVLSLNTTCASIGLLAGLAGRSSYVNPDAIQGVEDPGATAVAIAFRAAAKFSSLH